MEDVASIAESAEELQAVPLQLWDSLRESGHPQVLLLSVPGVALPDGVGDQLVDAILVHDLGSAFWLAVPGSAWPRRRALRLVPIPWVERALAARVLSTEAISDDVTAEYVPVSLLRCRPVARDALSLPPPGALTTALFVNADGLPALPDGGALMEACEPHLEPLLPAQPAPATPVAPAAPAESSEVSGRLDSLELSVASMRSLLEGYFGPPPAPGLSQPGVAPAGLRPARPVASGPPSLPASVPKTAGALRAGGIEPAVLRSAAAAGLDPGRLEGLQHILRGPGGRLPPEPALAQPGATLRTDSAPPGMQATFPNSGFDDIDGEELLTADEGQPPVERALLALTRIAGQLASNRPAQLADPLERALEGLSGSVGSEAYPGISLRKGAAARRALVEAVTARPASVYGPIETLMREAVQGGPASHAAGSGSSLEVPNPFTYLEHRSRVSNYRSTVNWMWQLASIHKALIDGKPEIARARTALALAAGEQMSMDGGSWTLAWEVTLMDEPPYDAFNRAVADTGQPHRSKLIDPRWLEVHLSTLRDRDDMQERIRRLQGGKRPPATLPPDDDGGGKGNPKWRPKGGPKGKGAPPPKGAPGQPAE